MAHERLTGVLCPVITPFDPDLTVDFARSVGQCKWLLSQDVGLAIFGTNSEANSLSVDEKISLLDALVDAGIPADRMMPGTGCCALPDTVRLTQHADSLGSAGTLVLPPFFYKGVSDDGLFASYSEVIQRVASESLRIYLYDIEPVSKVSLSHDVIERLITTYPTTIAGIKDSTGDWNNTQAMHERQWDDFRIFVGSETFLLQNMRAGGAGCISATANINPAAIHDLFVNWQSADALRRQEKLDAIRAVAMSYPMIPALKATVAHFSATAAWSITRPPLVALSSEQQASLIEQLSAHDFDMPGLS